MELKKHTSADGDAGFTAILWKRYDNNTITNLELLRDDDDNLPLTFATELEVKDRIETDLSYCEMEYNIIPIKSVQDQQQELKYEEPQTLARFLDILSAAKCYLDYADYVAIWGAQIGEHIWRQEGSDLLRIWRSGLTMEQKERFVSYITQKDKKIGENFYQKEK